MLITTGEILEIFGIGFETFDKLELEPEEIDRSKQGRPKKLYESLKVFEYLVDTERLNDGAMFTDDQGNPVNHELEKTLLIREQRRAQELKNNEFYGTHAPPWFINCVVSHMIKVMSDEFRKGCRDDVASIKNIDQKVVDYFTRLTDDVIASLERIKEILPEEKITNE